MDPLRPSVIICYPGQLDAFRQLLASVQPEDSPPYEYADIDPDVQQRVAKILRERGFPEYQEGK